jgi:hypothetical protein
MRELTMKNVQVRFSDEVYKGLERITKEDQTTLSDVLRKGIQLYGILRGYQKEGKTITIVAKSGDFQAELIIPGITTWEPTPAPTGESAVAR